MLSSLNPQSTMHIVWKVAYGKHCHVVTFLVWIDCIHFIVMNAFLQACSLLYEFGYLLGVLGEHTYTSPPEKLRVPSP